MPFTPRDEDRLIGVHPRAIAQLRRVFDIMATAHAPMFVVQGVRTLAEQQALYAHGRNTKGPKVTNCDGLTKKSNHQPHDDGWGYAIDCAFLADLPFDDQHPWDLFGTVAKDNGFRWGGDWLTFPDRPHLELRTVPEGTLVT